MSNRSRRQKREQRLQSLTPASEPAPARPSPPAAKGRSWLVRNRGWLTALVLLMGVALISYVGITVLARPTPATPTVTPAEPAPSLSPLTLMVLHTNDTWGYTRPCG